jgi:DNA invertase Pin-like site-specific DNA recombinase
MRKTIIEFATGQIGKCYSPVACHPTKTSGPPADGSNSQILAALSQFERERLKERTVAGLQRARAQGKRLGRPSEPVPIGKLEAVSGVSVREGARRLGVARSTLQRWRALARQNPSATI